MPAILVVDDHPAICYALKIYLEAEKDLCVMTTTDGGAVMALIRQHPVDLVILDIALLRLDGLDLLARIKHCRPATRVLMLSGLAADKYARRSLLAGADGFLSKQHLLSAIRAAVRLLLEGYSCFPADCLRSDSSRPARRGSALLSHLSNREITVLRYLAEGKTNKQIGELLQLSNKTVSTYKARLLEKSGAASLAELLLQLEEPPP